MHNVYNESGLQSKCFTDMWNYYPELRGRLFSITNNSHNKIKGAFNKAIGVVKGVSDMCFIRPMPRCPLWIEFKVENRPQKPEQKQWQKMVEQLGYEYVIVQSEEEFWKAVEMPHPKN